MTTRSTPTKARVRAPARRSQEERSSTTQQLLCQAAVDLLSEVGYERLTTAQIAQRAGVSKGAQAHHYPTKDDMLVAAFQHLLAQWESQRESFARQLGDRVRMEDLLQYLWRHVFGRPDYLASVELMLAVRHSPVLRERLREVLRSWTVVRDDIFRRLLPTEDPTVLATFMQLNFCLLRGLAVYEDMAADKAMPKRVLAMWSEMATEFLARRPAAPSRRSRARAVPSAPRRTKP